MQVGNARYLTENDLPDVLPVFPIAGVLLLPGGQLPLNIFEPRYLAMFDAAMAGNRLIGMIQPALNEGLTGDILPERPTLCQVGCIGRITSLTETGDGRYITSLGGICRFRLLDEVNSTKPYAISASPPSSPISRPARTKKRASTARACWQPSAPISTPTSLRPTGKASSAPAISPWSIPCR